MADVPKKETKPLGRSQLVVILLLTLGCWHPHGVCDSVRPCEGWGGIECSNDLGFS